MVQLDLKPLIIIAMLLSIFCFRVDWKITLYILGTCSCLLFILFCYMKHYERSIQYAQNNVSDIMVKDLLKKVNIEDLADLIIKYYKEYEDHILYKSNVLSKLHKLKQLSESENTYNTYSL
ncbi:hypothetical protein DZC34_19985 [Clostridium botulinum]|nr:hypothetical protein DZC34_19985 [Clostridium botulinum]